MARTVAGDTYEQEVRKNVADFKVLETNLKARYNALTTGQKATLMGYIANWNTATAAQKSDALLAAAALTIIVVGYIGRHIAPVLFKDS